MGELLTHICVTFQAKNRLDKIEREMTELQQRLDETKGEISSERKQRPMTVWSSLLLHSKALMNIRSG